MKNEPECGPPERAETALKCATHRVRIVLYYCMDSNKSTSRMPVHSAADLQTRQTPREGSVKTVQVQGLVCV